MTYSHWLHGWRCRQIPAYFFSLILKRTSKSEASHRSLPWVITVNLPWRNVLCLWRMSFLNTDPSFKDPLHGMFARTFLGLTVWVSSKASHHHVTFLRLFSMWLKKRKLELRSSKIYSLGTISFNCELHLSPSLLPSFLSVVFWVWLLSKHMDDWLAG